MGFKVYEKLVRDKIPEQLRARGFIVESKTYLPVAYKEALRNKLLEESTELLRAKNGKESMEEIADVIEVLRAIADEHGVKWKDILHAGAEKRRLKGGFGKKQCLVSVSESAT